MEPVIAGAALAQGRRHMRSSTFLSAIAALVAVPASARALSQPDHQTVSVRACRAAALPEVFCLSVGRAAYDTDAEAWEDPSAHAQMPEKGDPCGAADASAGRLAALGRQVRAALADAALDENRRSVRLSDAARDLGRALHTLEDSCAHAGMPNAQHAFLTDSDLCHGTHENPDVQPEALDCAARVAGDAIDAFTGAVIAAGLDPQGIDCAAPTSWTRYPELGEVCDFMQLAPAWDGVDRRWDNAVVIPRLADALSRALGGADDEPPAMCPHGSADIARTPDPVRAVGAPTQCPLIDAFCLAGEPTRSDLVPPFYNPDGVRGALGCSLGRGNERGCAGLFLVAAAALALALVWRRRAAP